MLKREAMTQTITIVSPPLNPPMLNTTTTVAIKWPCPEMALQNLLNPVIQVCSLTGRGHWKRTVQLMLFRA